MSTLAAHRATRRLGWLAGTVILMAGMVGCGSSEPSTVGEGGGTSDAASQSGPSGQDTSSGGPIKIYAVGPFTGDRAAQSLPVLHGGEVAVEVLNEEGGIAGRSVELVVKDSRGDNSAAVAAAQEAAATEGVYALVLGGGSPEASALEPILKDEGWPVFSVGTSPATNQESFPNFFRMNTLATDSVIPAVRSAKEQGAAGIGLLVLNNDYGNGIATSFEAAAAAEGIEIVDTVAVAPTATNLAPEVAKLKDQGVEYVATALTPPQTLAAAEAGAAIGYEPTWQFNGADLAFPATRNLLGEHAEGVEIRYVSFPLDPGLQTNPEMSLDDIDMSDEAKRFWSVWSEDFGGLTEINGNEVAAMPAFDWWSYDAVMMVAAAIEEQGATPDEVVDAIESIGSFELVASYPDIGETHEFHSSDDLVTATLQGDGTIDYGS